MPCDLDFLASNYLCTFAAFLIDEKIKNSDILKQFIDSQNNHVENL